MECQVCKNQITDGDLLCLVCGYEIKYFPSVLPASIRKSEENRIAIMKKNWEEKFFLGSQLEDHKAKLKHTNAELDTTTNYRNSLETELKQNQEALRSANEKLKDTNITIKQLTDDNRGLKAENSQLKTEIEKSINDLESKQISLPKGTVFVVLDLVQFNWYKLNVGTNYFGKGPSNGRQHFHIIELPSGEMIGDIQFSIEVVETDNKLKCFIKNESKACPTARNTKLSTITASQRIEHLDEIYFSKQRMIFLDLKAIGFFDNFNN